MGASMVQISSKLVKGRDERSRFCRAHADGHYLVAMIGFMPGFPYLTGLPQAICLSLAELHREVPFRAGSARYRLADERAFFRLQHQGDGSSSEDTAPSF